MTNEQLEVERFYFEKWFSMQYRIARRVRPKVYSLKRGTDGGYLYLRAIVAWEGWKARARREERAKRD